MPFYHTFSHLPLFQGLTEAELVTIAGNTRLEFKTISAGETVVEEGAAEAPAAPVAEEAAAPAAEAPTAPATEKPAEAPAPAAK